MASELSKVEQSESQQPNDANNVAAITSSAILKTIPVSYTSIKFSELQPFREYRNNYIWGTIVHAYPLQARQRTSYLRKFRLTDALDPDSSSQLTVFLLDTFAKKSESAKEGDYLGISDFKVENLTRPCQNPLLLPIQVYLDVAVKSETEDCTHRHIWIKQKVETPPAETNQEGESSRLPIKKRLKKVTKKPAGAVDGLATRSYTYSSLITLTLALGDDHYFSIYGVVDSCHLKTYPATQKQVLKLTLSDSTHPGFQCTIFCKKNDGPFPYVHPGDVVRIHRLKLTTVRGKLTGRCVTHKFIVVFEKNSNELQPKSTAKSFVHTDDDKEKVKALFLWAETRNLPKLICDIKPGEDVSLIVQVIGVYVSKMWDIVTLKVWDGTKNDICERKHLCLPKEKLDCNLFKISKSYYINLFIYGNYSFTAGQLEGYHGRETSGTTVLEDQDLFLRLKTYQKYQVEPGQYIFVRHANITSRPSDAGALRLIVPSLVKEDRGVYPLDEEDPRVTSLKGRLQQIKEEVEAENRERDLDRENEENFFLDCDISTFMPSQQTNAFDFHPSQASNYQLQIPNDENPVISVVRASIQPGQSTQEFGALKLPWIWNLEIQGGIRLVAVEPSHPQFASETRSQSQLTILPVSQPQPTDLVASQPRFATTETGSQPPSAAAATGIQPQSTDVASQLQVATADTGSQPQPANLVASRLQFATAKIGSQRQSADRIASQPQSVASVTRSQPQRADLIASQLQSASTETGSQPQPTDLIVTNLKSAASELGRQPLLSASETGNHSASTSKEISQSQLTLSETCLLQLVSETESHSQTTDSETGLSQLVALEIVLSHLVSETESCSQTTDSKIICQPQSISSEPTNHQLLDVPQIINHQPPAIPETVNHIVSNSEIDESKQIGQEVAHVLSLLCSLTESNQDNQWRSINNSVSVTDKHSHIRPSSLSDVVKHSVPYKFRVMAFALHFEPEAESINELICLYCSFCYYICEIEAPGLEISHSDYDLRMFYCPKCRVTFPDKSRLLDYSFLITLNLCDRSSPIPLNVYLWHHHAVKFFKGITPDNALKNQDIANSIMEMLWKVCPNNHPLGTSGDTSFNFSPMLDCCVMSYTAGGITRYQIFDTILTV